MLLQRPPDDQSLIRLSTDGRFVDVGLFKSALKDYRPGTNNGPGAERYEIGDFLLLLRYDDGHSRQVAVTGLLASDPPQDDAILYLGRARFNKRK
jgi:hypothetical protein